MTTFAPFPVNPVLTGVALAYRNAKLIADEVAPRVPVAGESFKWLKHEAGAKFTVPDLRVGRKGTPAEVEFTATETDGSTEDFGLDDFVPAKDIESARAIPGFDPLATATENLADLLALGREVRTAGLLFGAANYAAANKLTLAGEDRWDDYAHSDPIDDIKTALDLCVIRPNVAVIGRPGWSKLNSHPKILAGVGKLNTGGGIATRAEVATLFELDEIIVGEGWVNVARPGQAVSRQRVWGKHCALLVRDKLANLQNGRPTFALTAQWGGRIAGDIPDPKRGLRGGTTVRVGEAVRELVVASDLGFFFETVVS